MTKMLKCAHVVDRLHSTKWQTKNSGKKLGHVKEFVNEVYYYSSQLVLLHHIFYQQLANTMKWTGAHDPGCKFLLKEEVCIVKCVAPHVNIEQN